MTLVLVVAALPAAVAAKPACNDGVDNDGDGATDYPADTGCTGNGDQDESSPPPAACNDGTDNDSDGKADYPADPGCASSADTDEYNAPPAACADGADNDSDGKTDYPGDPGCTSATDTDEYNAPPSATSIMAPFSSATTYTLCKEPDASGTCPVMDSTVDAGTGAFAVDVVATNAGWGEAGARIGGNSYIAGAPAKVTFTATWTFDEGSYLHVKPALNEDSFAYAGLWINVVAPSTSGCGCTGTTVTLGQATSILFEEHWDAPATFVVTHTIEQAGGLSTGTYKVTAGTYDFGHIGEGSLCGGLLPNCTADAHLHGKLESIIATVG